MMFPLPRVTAVMAAMGLSSDYHLVDPQVLAEASARGSLVHALIDAQHKGRPVRVPYQFRGYWHAYERFRGDFEHEPIYSELVVRHEQWRFIGHLDRIGWHGARRVLADWKCVKSLDEPAVEIQLGAYWLAYSSMFPTETIHECAAVQLRPDGQYRYFVVDHLAGSQVFKAALTLYHWRVKHGRIGPGNWVTG